MRRASASAGGLRLRHDPSRRSKRDEEVEWWGQWWEDGGDEGEGRGAEGMRKKAPLREIISPRLVCMGAGRGATRPSLAWPRIRRSLFAGVRASRSQLGGGGGVWELRLRFRVAVSGAALIRF